MTKLTGTVKKNHSVWACLSSYTSKEAHRESDKTKSAAEDEGERL